MFRKIAKSVLGSSAKELSQDEQDDVVDQLGMVLGSDSDTYDALYEEYYDQLDVDHQDRVDEEALDFADDAVGHPSWRSDGR